MLQSVCSAGFLCSNGKEVTAVNKFARSQQDWLTGGCLATLPRGHLLSAHPSRERAGGIPWEHDSLSLILSLSLSLSSKMGMGQSYEASFQVTWHTSNVPMAMTEIVLRDQTCLCLCCFGDRVLSSSCTARQKPLWGLKDTTAGWL